MSIKPFSWTCPFCSQPATITDNSVHDSSTILQIENKHGAQFAYLKFIVCPNPKCNEFSLSFMLYDVKYENGSWKAKSVPKKWNIIPPSDAKVFPDYIPESIRKDYLEACLIRDLSPKASATMSRRCLQGMIRDFWGIKEVNLKRAIEKIKKKVDPTTWKAIDAVRSVGNIGAHMEKDINLIIEVEPNEADLLIGLIETLIKEWYIHKYERETLLNDIITLKEEKDSKKKVKQTPTTASEEDKPTT